MKKRYLILDCFVDEPACFGVPPFVSPYPRYVFGALVDAGARADDMDYLTIEEVRKNDYRIRDSYEMVFLIGGAVVPGKYLGHKIGTAAEIGTILRKNSANRFALGGPAGSLVRSSEARNAIYLGGDIEKFAFNHARGVSRDERRNYDELRRWAPAGARIAAMHPLFPHLICEIETSRGCPRREHCSFCSEGLIMGVEFREIPDILAEVDALVAEGVSRFRMGRQADILQYGTECREYIGGFPRPSPDAVAELFSALRERRVRGNITTLNIDNANPGTIAAFPGESSAMLEAIASAVTPGDTLALGVESFDPRVVSRNGLKADRAACLEAVRMANRIGGSRVDGIPVLLPGINLLHGLTGESPDTFRINYEALRGIMEEGLLLKRINIRSVQPFPGTPLFERYRSPSDVVRKRYEFYRDRIRSEIDRHMLTRIYPAGTVLRELLVEERQFEYSLARQIASYAITARIPVPLPARRFTNAIVVGHRERSVLALPYPVDVNSLPQKALEFIPGVGKRKSGEIIMRRPLRSPEELTALAPAVPEVILKAMRFVSDG